MGPSETSGGGLIEGRGEGELIQAGAYRGVSLYQFSALPFVY